MKFEKIVSHLGKRGFATRKTWDGKNVIVFGMDNAAYIQWTNPEGFEYYNPSLADIKADDWVKLPYFWDGGKDDFLPFRKGFGK